MSCELSRPGLRSKSVTDLPSTGLEVSLWGSSLCLVGLVRSASLLRQKMRLNAFADVPSSKWLDGKAWTHASGSPGWTEKQKTGKQSREKKSKQIPRFLVLAGSVSPSVPLSLSLSLSFFSLSLSFYPSLFLSLSLSLLL